jgi:Ca2+-transporting ATPase
VINREMLLGVVVQAIVMTAAVLSAYLIAGAHPGYDPNDPALPRWQTVAFTTLVMSELLRAYTARSERYALFKIGVFGNKWMQYAVGASLIMMLLVIYVPFLQSVFGTVALSLNDWLMMTPFILLASVAAELTKAYLRASNAKSSPSIAR